MSDLSLYPTNNTFAGSKLALEHIKCLQRAQEAYGVMGISQLLIVRQRNLDKELYRRVLRVTSFVFVLLHYCIFAFALLCICNQSST